MSDYFRNGIIYEIVCKTTGKRYIGSTKHSLDFRMGGHTSEFKYYQKTGKIRCRSVLVMENKNYDYRILQHYPCERKDDLELEEGRTQILTECVNKTIAGYDNGGIQTLPVPQRYLDMIKGNNLTEREQKLKTCIEGRMGVKSKEYIVDREIKRLMNDLINRVIAVEPTECKVCNLFITRNGMREHNKSKKHRNNLCLKKIEGL
jgi:hypothetical protein